VNGPIAMKLQCVCHDTLPWFGSVSLDGDITSNRHYHSRLDFLQLENNKPTWKQPSKEEANQSP
jgi:hypothetical protein